MGCACSKNSDIGPGHRRSQATGGSPVELVAPDPDLGWRRIPSPDSLASGNLYTVGSKPAIADKDNREWSTGTSTQPLEHHRHHGGSSITAAPLPDLQLREYPNGWLVNLYNDRSRDYCKVSLVIMAINISVRAERLARAFGILNDAAAAAGASPAADTVLSGSSSSLLLQSSKNYGDPTTGSRREVYATLGIPDFGWNLLRRRNDSIGHDSTAAAKSHREQRMCMSLALQLLEQGGHGKKILADVPSIGMNIAEQLHRLERKRDSSHNLPTETFGWSYQGQNSTGGLEILVITPDGKTISMIPEEMIMNVTQWVQETYLTSTIF